jgi:hypothetical protein
MEIIGLSCYARSGKDETAKILVEEFGFVRVGFADKLREMLYALNPIIGSTLYETDSLSIRSRNITLQDIIDGWGWDGYKETIHSKEIRRLLQRLGTEAGRQTLWDSIWIDAAFKGLPEDAKVVVSDARFFNEFDAIYERGGEVWRIDRVGVGPANDHPSETEAQNYRNFAVHIHNDGTLEDLRKSVVRRYLERVK